MVNLDKVVCKSDPTALFPPRASLTAAAGAACAGSSFAVCLPGWVFGLVLSCFSEVQLAAVQGE